MMHRWQDQTQPYISDMSTKAQRVRKQTLNTIGHRSSKSQNKNLTLSCLGELVTYMFCFSIGTKVWIGFTRFASGFYWWHKTKSVTVNVWLNHKACSSWTQVTIMFAWWKCILAKGRNFHGEVGSSSALWSERQRSDRRFSFVLPRIALVIWAGSLCQLSLHTSHKLGPIYPEHPALNGNDYQDSQTLFTQYVFIKAEKKRKWHILFQGLYLNEEVEKRSWTYVMC